MNTLLSLALMLQPGPIALETRTLSTGPGQYLLTERIVDGKAITVVSKTLDVKGQVSFSTRTYSLDGIPIHTRQEGQWNDRWNVFETSYDSKGAVQTINGSPTKSTVNRKAFRDQTILWFWKIHPKLGESVTVDFLAQNTIATFQIKFTYEGDEKFTLLGREVTLHRVREDPGVKGVYTLWWYDDQGMGVKRFHKTTKAEFSYDLAAWR